MTEPADLEALAATLEASGRYRVLRRLERRPSREAPSGVELRQGLYLDIETTGLDSRGDEIIELAMLPFWFSRAGEVFRVGEPFQAFRQPSRSIGAEITALTGITDAMVEGHTIDVSAVAAFAAPAVLVIAHNAAFDRRFMERFCETFSTKARACSMAEVDWKGEGHDGAKLSALATSCGFFYDGHRAAHDCEAGLEILAQTLPRSGVTALSRLLDNARRPVHRIWAENSPFELKDVLRRRGYRWNPEGGPAPKAWYVDVPPDSVEAELSFLKREIYQREVDLMTKTISAYDRYSERC